MMRPRTQILAWILIIIPRIAWTYEFNAVGTAYHSSRLPMPYFIDANAPPANNDQLLWIQEAFQAWIDIPTSKVSWEYKGMTSDPIPFDAGRVSVSGLAGNGSITMISIIDENSYIDGFTLRIGNEGVCGQREVFLAIAMHEIGHAMGLGHSADPDAMMYPVFNYFKPPTALGADDIAGAEALYPEGNERPTARLTAQPAQGAISVEVTLDGSASTDKDGTIAEYIFDFGDGSPILSTPQPAVKHTYVLRPAEDSSLFYPTLQVVDDKGGRDFRVDLQVTVTVSSDAPPAAPTGLQASTQDGLVDLSWLAPADPDVVAYLVRRATTAGGPYSTVATVPTPQTTWTDGDVECRTYFYVLRAKDAAGSESVDSAEASASTCREEPDGGSDATPDRGEEAADGGADGATAEAGEETTADSAAEANQSVHGGCGCESSPRNQSSTPWTPGWLAAGLGLLLFSRRLFRPRARPRVMRL